MAKKHTPKKPVIKPEKKTNLNENKRSGSGRDAQKGTGPRTKK